MNINYGLKQPSNFSSLGSYGSLLPNTGVDLTSAPNYGQMISQGLGLQAPTSFGQLPGQQAGGGGILDGISSWFKDSGVLGSTAANGIKTDGWGGLALGTASGLMNAYMGMKQYGLAKDTLKQNKEQFNKNYTAQKATTNAALEDRQRARVASNAGAYVSVGDYMNKNGIK